MKTGTPYIPHTGEDIKRMCEAIGVGSVEALLSAVPEGLRLKEPLLLPEGLSEQELKTLLEDKGKKNSTVKDYSSFLGAGAYNHYIPSVVNHITLRQEFYTSYTPYQPEISQGTLQAIFEYQTLICQLTGMEVSNASLYDGASATAEAVLMARRVTQRKKILLSSALHPEYRQTVRTYLGGDSMPPEDVFYCTEAGVTLPEAVNKALDGDTACLIVQSPNFFGCVEDIEELSKVVRAKGALMVVAVTEPLSLGILRPPGELGCDIAIGEAQSFGNPVSFGGPYVGFMATKMDYVRQMPGRIVGSTLDKNGRRSFCLTFSTREQHIRRERATSNICTNQGLSALAAAAYLAAVGKSGFKRLSMLNLSKANYLKESLSGVKGIKTAFSSPTFNEFVIEINADPEEFLKELLKKGIIGGLSLKRFYPELNRRILVSATEMNSKEEILRYAECASKILGRHDACTQSSPR